MFRKLNICSVVLLLVLSMQNTAHAENNQSTSIKLISPIFSQLLMHSIPAGFKAVFENINGNNYIREAVLNGENEKQWTQMITVSGAKSLASNTNDTPEKLANSIASGFKKACPNSYGMQVLQPETVVDGYDNFTTVVSCGTSPTTGGQTSESALIIVIKGTNDYYTIQWAERSSPSEKPIPIDNQKWKARLSKLIPITLCPIIPGEKAPYPSCLETK